MKNPFTYWRRRREQDRIASEHARRYGMLSEYRMARRAGLSPIEALEDWDLLTPQLRTLLSELT